MMRRSSGPTLKYVHLYRLLPLIAQHKSSTEDETVACNLLVVGSTLERAMVQNFFCFLSARCWPHSIGKSMRAGLLRKATA